MQNTVNPDELDLSDFKPETSAQDGLITGKKVKEDNKKSIADELTVPGCIVKKLDRGSIKPMYIEDICIGYLYLETKDGMAVDFTNSLFDRTSSDILG